MKGSLGSTAALEGSRTGGEETTQDEWVALARDCYRSSTDYFESEYYREWEASLAMFNSEHPPGSKYHSKAYTYRSKLFRPKTRAAATRALAASAVAFFSTDDIVNIRAEDQGDPQAVVAAAIRHELLNYRLKNSVPWFLTVLGAFQTAWIMGAVCSYQEWKYEESEQEFSAIEAGEIVKTKRNVIVHDKPSVELIPLENLRFDPAADWMDPVNSSPYWIQLIPMYVQDVKERTTRIDDKTGQPEWNVAEESAYFAARTEEFNSVRQAREGRGHRDAKKDNDPQVKDHEIVWVMRVFIRKDGKDWIYYTLGTEHRLSEPKLVKEVYLQGRRPYAWGFVSLETHRVIPRSQVNQAKGLQVLANEIVNQRIDNVKLVLNKRYKVSRKGNVDTNALVQSVPGGGVLMDDVNTGVKEIEFNDVTGSAYQEQDRVNLDFDELVGSFSMGSVQSNRKLNETVGGMEMLSQDANSVTELTIRLFAETWMKRVLEQLDELEVAYETDENILAVAGQRGNGWERDRGIGQSDMDGKVTVSVNVGFSATNPRARVEKLVMGISSVLQLAPAVASRLNVEEVIKEVFGALGYQDGNRFFKGPEGEGVDPMVQDLGAQLQQAMAMIEQLKSEVDAKIAMNSEDNQTEILKEQIKADTQIQIANMRGQQAAAKAGPEEVPDDDDDESGDPLARAIRGE